MTTANLIRTDVMSALDRQVHVRTYGVGWLVDTNLQYADGDTVRVAVRSTDAGCLVTDRAAAMTRQGEPGDTRWIPDAVKLAAAASEQAAGQVPGVGLPPAGDVAPGEVAIVGDAETVGDMVLAVARGSVTLEDALTEPRPAAGFGTRQAPGRWPVKPKERCLRVAAAALFLAGMVLSIAANVVYSPYEKVPVTWVIADHLSNLVMIFGFGLATFVYGRYGRRGR